MALVVHGVPGRSLRDTQVGDRDSARRGAWFEEQTGKALGRWFDGRPETFHVFHDLCGLVNVSGAGLQPISLGGSNIDHLILTGNGWVMVDAKGFAAGALRVRDGPNPFPYDGTVAACCRYASGDDFQPPVYTRAPGMSS